MVAVKLLPSIVDFHQFNLIRPHFISSHVPLGHAAASHSSGRFTLSLFCLLVQSPIYTSLMASFLNYTLRAICP